DPQRSPFLALGHGGQEQARGERPAHHDRGGGRQLEPARAFRDDGGGAGGERAERAAARDGGHEADGGSHAGRVYCQGAGALRAWSFPGSPLTKAELLLAARGAGVSHHFTVNEHVAASMALGGALLSGHGTAAMMKHVGVNVALDTLATFGMVNELRSPALL